MTELDSAHHIFRHVGGASIHDDFIDPAVFRRKKLKDGTLEPGLSVNWHEYFQKATPEETIAPLCEILRKKGRTIGPTSKFALLNVGAAKESAAQYTSVSIVLNEQDNDPSHSLVQDYDEALNELVAEQLQKVIIAAYQPTPSA